MAERINTSKALIVNVDGLRPDVLGEELRRGTVPNLATLLGGADAAERLIPCVSTAPSITFCAQATIATGAHPGQHGVPGNDFFDRDGRTNGGSPRHLGFDVGDTYAVNDAVSVFRSRLADAVLNRDTPTIYESMAAAGGESLVAHSMYARGAQQVIGPWLTDLARMTVLRGIFGMRRGEFDAHMLRQVDRSLERGSPDLLALYFMGLDKEAHEDGPHQQGPYLREVLDPQVGELVRIMRKRGLFDDTIVALISDHGQSPTPGDDAHSVRLGFPFDRELVHLFTALRLDVHDYPGKAPKVDAVVGLNGGIAHVYLRNREGEWREPPRFADDVLRVAEAFVEMNRDGRYCAELKGTLDLILVRDSSQGFHAPYQVYEPGGALRTVAEVFAARDPARYPDAEARIRLLNSPLSGDIILLAQAERGVYFGKPGLRGVHGSLLKEDSESTLALSLPGGTRGEQAAVRQRFVETASARALEERRSRLSIADLSFALRKIWGRLAPKFE
ncbi:MAG: alkaline phosphatase family protein [Proteobacteria bacterium]|nr:alkaline phosphatase family protein [Pseudomonadota bacterium]